jgi:hypothetical protein
MKQIISTIEVIVEASRPTETFKILFKEARSAYDSNNQSETIAFNAYKVIDEAEEVYELVSDHKRSLDKATLDAIRASLTVDANPVTEYCDYRNEELIKGIAFVINADGIYGLTTAQLILS